MKLSIDGLSKKKLISNIFSLYLLQAANYLIPLLTIPYLLRVLGSERFGLIAFAQALIQYFVNLTDFGFNYLATKNIAQNKENKERVSEIFSNTYFQKLFLLVLSFVLLLLIVNFIPKLKKDHLVYFITFSMVIGNALFPIWLFQGLEEMKYISIFTLVSKAVFTVAIFIFVKGSDDYLLAAAFQSSWVLLAAILSIGVISRRFLIRLSIPKDFGKLVGEFRESGKIYVTSLSNNIYSHGSVLITGYLTSMTMTAYFTLGQKVVSALTAACQPVAQGLYPYLAREFISNREMFFKIRKKVLRGGALYGIVVSIFLFSFSKQISHILAGSFEADKILKAFAVIMIFIIISILLTPFALSMNKLRELKNLYIWVALLFILTAIPLTKIYDLWGMLISLLAIEIIIAVGTERITKERDYG